jgi:hypothetical protein
MCSIGIERGQRSTIDELFRCRGDIRHAIAIAIVIGIVIATAGDTGSDDR